MGCTASSNVVHSVQIPVQQKRSHVKSAKENSGSFDKQITTDKQFEDTETSKGRLDRSSTNDVIKESALVQNKQNDDNESSDRLISIENDRQSVHSIQKSQIEIGDAISDKQSIIEKEKEDQSEVGSIREKSCEENKEECSIESSDQQSLTKYKTDGDEATSDIPLSIQKERKPDNGSIEGNISEQTLEDSTDESVDQHSITKLQKHSDNETTKMQITICKDNQSEDGSLIGDTLGEMKAKYTDESADQQSIVKHQMDRDDETTVKNITNESESPSNETIDEKKRDELIDDKNPNTYIDKDADDVHHAAELAINEPDKKPGNKPVQEKSIDESEFDTESENTSLYVKIDKHARTAPESVKESIEDLVNYLSTASKQPKMLVRALFVWMSENIKYDVDGYFGRTERSSCDAMSVIKNGKCVCEGYANVMDVLCRQAGINVQKISGYAKGVGHSEDHVTTTREATNHAWNAVELDGKWHLVDGTWGTGHLNGQNQFEKGFEEFYFLADPEQLINTHFPYMDNDMASSMKWQLLKSPVSLEEFNKRVRRWPASYKLGVQPASHKHGYVEVGGKLEMAFKLAGTIDVDFSEKLMVYDGNFIREIRNATMGQREGNMYKIRICPPKGGKYDFTLFGKKAGDEGSLSQLFEYLLKCNNSKEVDFQYPMAYLQAQKDRCILHEPMKNNLPPNSNVRIGLSSPLLLRVMINQGFLNKTGDRFEGIVKTGAPGTRLSVYGSRQDSGALGGLYVFDIK